MLTKNDRRQTDMVIETVTREADQDTATVATETEARATDMEAVVVAAAAAAMAATADMVDKEATMVTALRSL